MPALGNGSGACQRCTKSAVASEPYGDCPDRTSSAPRYSGKKSGVTIPARQSSANRVSCAVAKPTSTKEPRESLGRALATLTVCCWLVSWLIALWQHPCKRVDAGPPRYPSSRQRHQVAIVIVPARSRRTQVAGGARLILDGPVVQAGRVAEAGHDNPQMLLQVGL